MVMYKSDTMYKNGILNFLPLLLSLIFISHPQSPKKITSKF